MQTFLPYGDFAKSAKVLDRQRLGKQRIECKQILHALIGTSKGWVNHPATVMWRGYEHKLCRYGIEVCREWILRGYKDRQHDYFCYWYDNLIRTAGSRSCLYPPWLWDEDLHASHRSNLLRKDPEHYGQFGWTEPNDLPYVWPSDPTVIS